jgi:uncharacterized RDD family membrane protein YckC
MEHIFLRCKTNMFLNLMYNIIFRAYIISYGKFENWHLVKCNMEKFMTGKTLRLANFLVDSLIYFTFLVVFLMVFKNTIDQNKIKLISILFYFLYYFLFEYFIGQTLGKMITRSKVISLQENKGNYFFQILLRSIMRFIPLDMLSYLFSYRGLHDWISKTTIIKL